jgi:ribosomal protein S18 acetylase RimI-like enzyme
MKKIKAYKCTDCKEISYLEDNGEIRVGFCKKCGHPLWNPPDKEEEIKRILMRTIRHNKQEDWGTSVFIMGEFGLAFGNIYWYNDDHVTAYISSLSIEPQVRGRGIGNQLLRSLEIIAAMSGYTKVCLWVDKGTWMHGWYLRHGYAFLKDHELRNNQVWLIKNLKARSQTIPVSEKPLRERMQGRFSSCVALTITDTGRRRKAKRRNF